MALLSLDELGLTLGGTPLFAELALRVAKGDRIGLIGPNGCGKSSLLRLIAGKMEPDEGRLHRKSGLRVGFLPQRLDVPGGRSVLQFLRDSIPGRTALDKELAEVEQELAQTGEGGDARVQELSERLADLHERLQHFDRDYGDHIGLQILSGLGFSAEDSDRDLATLSGGWQMRVVLASLLFLQPDLLLMDEPTNHLDMPSVAWFSSYLQQYQRAFLLVSHDREFLNEQVCRVVSFEPEGVRCYSGNYDAYLEQRRVEADLLANRQRNLAREREKAEQFISRFRAQATKARAVQSRIKALERLDTVDVLGEHDAVHFRFPPTARTSKEVLRVSGLTRAYGLRPVLSNVDLSVAQGEKIGVIGINGAGKTTLLRMLADVLDKDAGEIVLGAHVERSYYAQDLADALDGNRTVYQAAARVAGDRTPTAVRTLLGALLFAGDDIDKPISVLSGGERARVALAQLLLSSANLLLMDEPTTHLDLQTSERLAAALKTYDGTLIFVSHNRSFVRTLATRIWHVEGGSVETYPGTLDEYMSSVVRRFDLPQTAGLAAVAADSNQGKKERRTKEKERRRREAEDQDRLRRLRKPLKSKIAGLLQQIESLEVLQAERSETLADPDLYQASDNVGDLLKAYHADAAELEELVAEWEAMEKALAEVG